MTARPGFFDETCEDLALFSGTPVPAVVPPAKRKPAPKQLRFEDEDLAVYDDSQGFDLDQADPGPLWS